MNKTFKWLSACIISFALCFHFIWVVVYCFPHPSVSINWQRLSQLYIYPVFHQNWGLFVPAPNVERHLFVRYKTANKFTNWEDILAQEITTHKRNRILGYEARVLLLSNALIYELNALDRSTKFVYTAKPYNKEFKVLQFEVEHYLNLKHKLQKSVDYELLFVSSGRLSSKAYYIKSLSKLL
jgi:hypothetical protein